MSEDSELAYQRAGAIAVSVDFAGPERGPYLRAVPSEVPAADVRRCCSAYWRIA